MNKPDTKLDECIYVAKNIIPADLCDAVIKDIETRPWEPHSWYSNKTSDPSKFPEKMELDIQYATPELYKILSFFVIETGTKYNEIYSFKSKSGQIINHFTGIRLNRYAPGQIMRQHHDNIHSIFDGKSKGVPVLSFIFNFNDDYEGADLYFWKDTIVPLGKGDICMFPSCFLFPHGVTEATKGIRYSGVTWAW